MAFQCGTAQDVTTKGDPFMFWGLGGINDYEPPRFIDWARQGRRWVGGSSFLAPPHVDGNGNIIALPSGVNNAYQAVRVDEYDRDDGPKNMKVMWDGAVESVAVSGSGTSSVNTSVPGQVTFVYNAPGTTDADLIVTVTPTLDGSRNVTGDPVRIYCIDTDYGDEWNAGEIFLPYQVEPIDSACLGARFMDWLKINFSTLTSWADRPTMDFVTYAGGGLASPHGCPLELCIAWCNKFQKHGWFHIPHAADDEYITNAATLIRDTLDPNLHVFIAYSNEVWNGAFSQHGYAMTQALADFGSTDYWAEWQSKRSTEMALIFRSVFAGQLNRLHPQLESHQAGPNTTTKLLYPEIWESTDPENYVDPKTVHEGCAISGYFYTPTDYSKLSEAEGAAIWEAFQNSEEDAIDTLMGYLTTGVAAMKNLAATHHAIISAAGLAMTMYEGQTHTALTYAAATILYQQNLFLVDATGYTVGETVDVGPKSFEVLAKSGQFLTVTPGTYVSKVETEPNFTLPVVGRTSGESQYMLSKFRNIDASGFVVGETATQTGGDYSITGEVMTGTDATNLVIKATSYTGGGFYWRPNLEPIIGGTSGASIVPTNDAQIQRGDIVPRSGVADMWHNAYDSAAYGTVLTAAFAAFREAGGTIWNQFQDMGRRNDAGCWNTMEGYSDRDIGVMLAIRAYCAANPRDFFL